MLPEAAAVAQEPAGLEVRPESGTVWTQPLSVRLRRAVHAQAARPHELLRILDQLQTDLQATTAQLDAVQASDAAEQCAHPSLLPSALSLHAADKPVAGRSKLEAIQAEMTTVKATLADKGAQGEP